MKIQMLTWMFLFLIQGTFCQLKFNNLNEVLTYADNNNISIKQGALDVRSLDANTKIAKAAFKPTINGVGNAGYDPIIPSQVVPDKLFGGTEGKFTKVQFGLPFNVSAGIEASLPIINFEKWEAIRSSHLETDKVRWSLEAVKENLHQQVTIHYYQALACRDLLQVNEENELVLKQLITVMEQRYEKGIVNPVDLNRSKSLLLDNQLLQVEYSGQLNVAMNALYDLLNVPAGQPLILADSLSVDWELPL